MLLLDRAASTVLGRTCRALGAWLLNRGMRDLWQRCAKGLRDLWRKLVWPRARPPIWRKSGRGRFKWFRQYLHFASHAGETRLFEYELEIGQPITEAAGRYFASMEGRAIRGIKKLTYSIACNPWRQLTELELTDFPNLLPGSKCVLDARAQILCAARETPARDRSATRSGDRALRAGIVPALYAAHVADDPHLEFSAA